ncbi:MAG: cysteine hydrolase, partial [Chloroflexota bacterium]|nr:cysteine hydrolase [Chloroflexota bacterium]
MQAASAVPEIPDPVAVTLDPTRTAVLALDLTDLLAGNVAACMETVPLVRALLDRAREAGALVAFSTGRAPGQSLLPGLGARAGEPVVSTSADKFFGTALERHIA